MTKLGTLRIGVSNNWRRMHGYPMRHTKRYPHERRDMPKKVRIHYHAMKKAQCDTELIARFLLHFDNFDLEKSKRSKRK